MRLLLLYNEHRKAREIQHFSDLNGLVEETFNLLPSSYLLQKFDKDFNEFVDLEDFSSLEDKDKIRIHVQQLSHQEELILEESPLDLEDFSSLEDKDKSRIHVQQLSHQEELLLEESPLDNSITLSIQSLHVVEDIRNLVVQPVHQQQWPLEVTLPFQNFSGNLKEMLESKKKLSWDSSRELIGHLANYAYSFKPYPNKRERLQVCEALVQRYPHLRNDVVAGIGGLELKLLNKLKRLRQNDTSLEVELNRLKSKVIGRKVPKRVSINPKKGELNWAPDHIPGETHHSVKMHQKFLFDESLKCLNFQDQVKIESLMSLTYSFRRELINNSIKVSELREEYPIFFQMKEQFNEFHRLTAVPIKDVFFQEAVEQGPVLYELFLKRKNCMNEVNFLETFKKEIEDMKFLKKQEAKAAFGFLVLPCLLKEDNDCIFKIVSDDIYMLSPEPKIYGSGSLLNGSFIIIVESIELTRCNTFLEAVCLLMSFYYTLNISYPRKAVNTLKFLQNSVLKINGGNIPPKVRTLMNKISK